MKPAHACRATNVMAAGIALALAVGGIASAADADLRVVGSDLLGLEFSKALHAFAANRGQTLAVTLDGSRPGVAALRARRADLALVVLPPDEIGALSEFAVCPLGYHRVVVLAPAAMNLEQITIEQLAKVFGRDAGATSMRWSDLGVEGEGASEPIGALAPDVGVGIAVEYFRRVVLGGGELKPTLQRYRTTDDLSRHFASASRALALASAEPRVTTGLKVLAVATQAGESAVLPTAGNLHAGRYALGLPLQLVFRADRRVALQPMIEYLCGDAIAALFEGAGIMPLPAEARAGMASAPP